MNLRLSYYLFLLGCFFYSILLQAQEVKLLSHQELAKAKYSTPYIYHLKKGQKELLFIGSHHSNDPTDLLFIIIKEQLDNFQPAIAFNEGGQFKIYSTPDSTIRNSWEPGYLRHLCKQSGIHCESIEPEPREEYDFILEKYKVEEAFLFYGYRYANQLKRQIKNESSIKIADQLDQFLTKLGPEIFGKKSKDYPILFKTLYKQKFRFAFEFGQVSPRFFAPTSFFTSLSQINRSLSDFRDLFVLDKIKQAFETHDRVFILMGAGHALRQEPLWEAYFEVKD